MAIEGGTPRETGIDLLRALSVLLVVLSHYDLLPPWFPLGGYHGVVVFFAVSGYCMAMTAPAKTFWTFWRARWVRLLPAFIVCALVTFAVEAAFPGERGQLPRDLFFTLGCIPTFDIGCEALNVYAISRGSGANYLFVDGAYWSLLVEFRFYLVFALVYFGIGSVWPVAKRFAWVALLVCATLAFWTPMFGQGRARDFAQYLPFFAFGLAAYQAQNDDQIGWAGMAASLVFLCAYAWGSIATVSIPFGWDSVAKYAVLMVAAFAALQWRQQHNKATALIRFVAVISYPLYLIHQDLGLTIIAGSSQVLGRPLSQAAALVASVAIAAAIHRFIERPVIAVDKLMRFGFAGRRLAAIR